MEAKSRASPSPLNLRPGPGQTRWASTSRQPPTLNSAYPSTFSSSAAGAAARGATESSSVSTDARPLIATSLRPSRTADLPERPGGLPRHDGLRIPGGHGQRGDGLLRLGADPAQGLGRFAAHELVLVLQGLDQHGHGGAGGRAQLA